MVATSDANIDGWNKRYAYWVSGHIILISWLAQCFCSCSNKLVYMWLLHVTKSFVFLQQMRRSSNDEDNKRIIMDLDVVIKSHSCPYIIQCIGTFIFTVTLHQYHCTSDPMHGLGRPTEGKSSAGAMLRSSLGKVHHPQCGDNPCKIFESLHVNLHFGA